MPIGGAMFIRVNPPASIKELGFKVAILVNPELMIFRRDIVAFAKANGAVVEKKHIQYIAVSLRTSYTFANKIFVLKLSCFFRAVLERLMRDQAFDPDDNVSRKVMRLDAVAPASDVFKAPIASKVFIPAAFCDSTSSNDDISSLPERCNVVSIQRKGTRAAAGNDRREILDKTG